MQNAKVLQAHPSDDCLLTSDSAYGGNDERKTRNAKVKQAEISPALPPSDRWSPIPVRH
jgi:hypothetical protein